MSAPHLMFANALLSAAGAAQQGRDAQRRAEYSARVHERDATIAKQRAALQARNTRREGAARAARARVRLGAAGGRLDGTPFDVLSQIAGDSELAALEDIYDGALNATAQQTRAQAQRMRGSAARRQGLGRAGSSLLRGASYLRR
ncbi:MAG: hypothetical protein JJ899_03075 [Alphaproteobacteria bacterium]|nr:hypothetical protein [Alphaproteobacteria bacterium]